MLKIKDNIDLNRLKDYGFISTIGNVWEKEENVIGGKDSFYVSILVNPVGAKVKNEIVYYFDNEEILESMEVGFVDTIGSIDTLYDLIVDGLVEKVVIDKAIAGDILNVTLDLKNKIKHKKKLLENLLDKIKSKDIKENISKEIEMIDRYSDEIFFSCNSIESWLNKF